MPRRRQRRIQNQQHAVTVAHVPKKPSVAKTSGIMGIGAFLAMLSIAVYVATTEGQELDIIFSSILINYLQNFLASITAVPNIGSTALDIAYRPILLVMNIVQSLRGKDIDTEQLLNDSLLPNPSLSLQTIKLFGGFPLSLIFAAPGTAATYISMKKHILKALGLSAANYLGSIPIFLFAMMKVIEHEGRWTTKKILTLFRRLFPESKDDQEKRQNLTIINQAFAERLKRLLDAIYRGELTNKDFPFSGTAEEKLAALATILSELREAEPPTSSYFDKPYSITSKMLFVYPIAFTVGVTATGYACSTGTLFDFLNYATAEFIVGNLFLLGLYYLGYKGARDTMQQFADWVQTLLHRDFEKATPDIVRYAPDWFRYSKPIIASSLTLGVVVLASRSGFTAKKLYDDYCTNDLSPRMFDEIFPQGISNFLKRHLLDGSTFNTVALWITDLGTVVFNAIYGYLTTLVLMKKYKEFRGSDEERFDIGLTDFLKNLINELPLFTDKQTEALFNLLSQLEPNQRQALLGTTTAISAANSLGQFGILRNTRDKRTYTTFSSIPAADSYSFTA